MRLIVAVMFILWTGVVLSAPITSDEVRVIDGDTNSDRSAEARRSFGRLQCARNSSCNLRSGTQAR